MAGRSVVADGVKTVPVVDIRDAAIEALADSEAALLDRVVDLTCERDSYRRLAQQLLYALHHVILERDILREQRQIDRRRKHEQRRAA